MIEFHRFSYWYPGQTPPALDEINWRVPSGSFTLVTGPSGSGKSTLLRALNGLVPHFSGGVVSGEVLVGGQDVIQAGPAVMSRKVGFVRQTPEAHAVLDRVEAELAFGLENLAIPPVEMRKRVAEIMDLLHLTNLREREISTLSGGEQQRVAIGTAMVLRPSLLVLDEPTSQLDPQSAEDVLSALERLRETLGVTIVLAEHRLERVLGFSDRLLVLENGRVRADGPVAQAAAALRRLPPVSELGRSLAWNPLPLTAAEAGKFKPKITHREKPGRTPLNGTKPNSKSFRLLEIKDLSFSYNDHPTLQGVNLEVGAGEAVALIGRNGAGKSTLLKCVTGLLALSSGEIVVNGRPIKGRNVADICREVAYLPQNPNDLLFADSAAEELKATLAFHNRRPFPAKGGLYQKMIRILSPEAEQDSQVAIDRRVEKHLADLGISELRNLYPRDLSAGQRQRVALGAVSITNPNLFLFDEPTRGLDYAAKEGLVALWQHWLAAGKGLLLVTHDVELAAQVADRVIVLNQGKVKAAGPAVEILSSSQQFAPQIARLFPGRGWLTVADVLNGLGQTATIE